jgi:hypothetical protein
MLYCIIERPSFCFKLVGTDCYKDYYKDSAHNSHPKLSLSYLWSLQIVWVVRIDDVLRILGRRRRRQRCKFPLAESSAEVDYEYDEGYEKEDAYDDADDGSSCEPVVVVVVAV